MVPAGDLIILEKSLPTDGGSHVRQIDTENSGALIAMRVLRSATSVAYIWPRPVAGTGMNKYPNLS